MDISVLEKYKCIDEIEESAGESVEVLFVPEVQYLYGELVQCLREDGFVIAGVGNIDALLDDSLTDERLQARLVTFDSDWFDMDLSRTKGYWYNFDG